MSTWAERKVAAGADLIEGFAMRNDADMREHGAAFPLKYILDNSIPVLGTPPVLPNAGYPIGAMYRDSSSLAPNTCHSFLNVGNVWIPFADKNYVLTGLRNQGASLGADEGNAHVFLNADGTCSFPSIDTGMGYGPDGFTSSLILPAVSRCTQNGGGYWDTTFLGHDVAHVEVGPHSAKPYVYIQWKYREDNMVQTWNGDNPSHQVKVAIIGNRPTIDAHYLGSSPTFASATYYESSIVTDATHTATKNSLIKSYTRQDHPNGNYGVEDTDLRGIYDQTGCGCPFSESSYLYPPCIGVRNRTWHEFTEYRELRPAITDGVISGNTLTSASAPFNASGADGLGKYPTYASFGRYVYVPVSGYHKILTVNSTSSVLLDGSPSQGPGKSVHISGFPNSIWMRWIDGIRTLNNSDQRFVWEDQDANVNGGTPGILTGNVGIGQIRFVDQMTNKLETFAHDPGYCWFNSLLISQAPIAMTLAGSAKLALVLR